MNHDLINKLFDSKFSKEIVVNFPWKQTFFIEKEDGYMEIRKVQHNIVSVKLHKERTKNQRFISVIPKYGIEFMASVSRSKTDKPVILDPVISKKIDVDLTSLTNLTISEASYFIEKFIKGVITDEKSNI